MMHTHKLTIERYRWTCIQPGIQRESGYLWASSLDDALSQLHQSKRHISDICLAPLHPIEKFRHRIKGRDVTNLTQQLATMLSAGLPMTQALALIASQTKHMGIKMLLLHLTHQITNGVSVTTAFKNATPHFQGIYTELLHAGEVSGQINEAFEQLTQYRERKEHLQTKLIKATMYPSIVILSAILLTFIMLTRVIPRFEMMFHQFGAELPWFTRQVLSLSHLMKEKGEIILFSFLVLIGFLKIANKYLRPYQHLAEQLQLRLPILGPLIIHSALIRCCRTLASCYHCGIPILECLQHAKNTMGLLRYQSALERAAEQVSSGVTLYSAIRNTTYFPEFMIQMIMVGEESGTLDTMLKKVASQYEQRVDQTVDQLGQLMEPLIILLLGIIVGGLIIAMYLPLFNLMAVVG